MPTNEEFIDEPIKPTPGTGIAAMAATGQPGVPSEFDWGGQRYHLAGIIGSWKTSGPCRHGGGEMYLRRHWYKLLVEPPLIMTIYCDRQARTRNPKSRWWLYSIEPARPDAPPPHNPDDPRSPR